MWFERMTLEVWFDEFQYEVDYDIGESAVKFKKLADLGLDLDDVPLRYGHHYGRPDLRAAIAEDSGTLNPENVIVTSGGSEAIYTLDTALLRPGDHVIVEQPNYPSLYTIPRGLGCSVSLFPLRYEDGFRPDLDRLEAEIRPETRLIAFTHPNNPTGSMITEENLVRLVGICQSRGVHLLFDETYREMDAVDRLPCAATLGDKVISVSTMSKSYGLPGIRIGWALSQDRDLIDRMLTEREHTTITNTALGEEIAYRVLSDKEGLLERNRAHIDRNKEIAASWIEGHEYVEWVYPEIGVVAFPRLKAGLELEPEKLYRTLVAKYKTFVIPGRCFEMDNRHFRLGFGATVEELRTGLANFDAALKDLLGA